MTNLKITVKNQKLMKISCKMMEANKEKVVRRTVILIKEIKSIIPMLSKILVGEILQRKIRNNRRVLLIIMCFLVRIH